MDGCQLRDVDAGVCCKVHRVDGKGGEGWSCSSELLLAGSGMRLLVGRARNPQRQPWRVPVDWVVAPIFDWFSAG